MKHQEIGQITCWKNQRLVLKHIKKVIVTISSLAWIDSVPTGCHGSRPQRVERACCRKKAPSIPHVLFSNTSCIIHLSKIVFVSSSAWISPISGTSYEYCSISPNLKGPSHPTGFPKNIHSHSQVFHRPRRILQEEFGQVADLFVRVHNLDQLSRDYTCVELGIFIKHPFQENC
jgi:hypothetical protein